MLVLAGDIPSILDLKRLHHAADIHGAHGFERISHSYVSNLDRGPVAYTRSLDHVGDHADNVYPVADEFVKFEGVVVGMPELKCYGMALPYSPAPFDDEKPGGVRLHRCDGQPIDLGDLDPSDGPLFRASASCTMIAPCSEVDWRARDRK